MNSKKMLALGIIMILGTQNIALSSYDGVQVPAGEVGCSEPVVPTPEPDCDHVDVPYVAPVAQPTPVEQKMVKSIQKAYTAPAAKTPAVKYHNAAPSTLPLTGAGVSADMDQAYYDNVAKKQKSAKIDAADTIDTTQNNFWDVIKVSQISTDIPLILATISTQQDIDIQREHASAQDTPHNAAYSIGLALKEHTMDAVLLLFLLFSLGTVVLVDFD